MLPALPASTLHSTFDFHDHDDDDGPDIAIAHCSSDQFPLREYGYTHSLESIPTTGKQAADQQPFAALPAIHEAPSRRPRHPTPAPRDDSMALVRDELSTSPASSSPPSSPPELTMSKSSKSSASSFHSSISDTAGPEDISHFEDIHLDDVHHDLHPNAVHKGAKRRPAPRSAQSCNSGGWNGAQDRSLMGPRMRDVTNAARPRYPSLKGQVNGVLRDQASLCMPNGRSMRRNFSSPSTSSLALMSAHSRSSRSPSPNKQHVYSSSPRSLPFTTPRASADGPLTGGPLGRRQSWQPGRKTVKELEAEYHDSDEDVPEDAVIWNVPISPLPPFERTPPRSPPGRSPLAPFEMDSFGNRGPRISPSGARLRSQNTSPQSSLRPNLVHSNTIAGVPGSRMSSVSRTQSWAAELSEEARDLTQALEAHAEAHERIHENAPAPRPSLDKHRANTMIVELPPVRKGNVMIDPLPISKEKEKVLTRTRPSWLPPKSQREEKKHLKEYQRMMAMSLEAEKRRAPKLQEEERNRSERQVSISRIWEQHVLPNWDAVIKEPRTRELWWRGITPRSRGTVWQKAIGNELGLAESSYKLALTRAKELDRRISALGTEEQTRVREAPWFAAIRRDSSATFPELKIFQPGGPLHDALLDVLMAYAMYRADIGYVYGTHTIAGLLLLNLSPAASFVALANVFNRPMPLAFLAHDVGAIGRAHALALNTLRHKLPALHAHLTGALKGQLRPADWLDPLLRTLLTHRVPVDVASRVWDVFVFEGDSALVRAAVAVLAALESRLYGTGDEVLELLGWEGHVWDLRDEDEFMAAVRAAGKA